MRRAWLHRWSAYLAIGLSALLFLGWLFGVFGPSSDPAVWGIDPDEHVTSDSTQFTVLVHRVGCNSGVDGEPAEPDIELEQADIVITFKVGPHSSGGDCQGTVGVPYLVDLGEPIGQRTIVDGECRQGSDAYSTSNCLKKGIRWASDRVFPLQ